MPVIQAVLFDLGETLLHYEPVDTLECFEQGARLAYEHLERNGHRLPSFARYHRRQRRAVKFAYAWSKLTGREFNSMDLLARMHRRMHLPADGATLRDLASLFYRPLGDHARQEPETTDVLMRLRTEGMSLGLISNTFVPAHTLDDHLRREGLLEFFPVRVYSCDLGVRKPNPRIFRLALERLGAEADRSLFVGDRLDVDVKGANRVGMISVLKAATLPDGGVRPRYHIRRLSEVPALIARDG
jgi:putative hydrolase of the HAD superfamily